MRSDLRDMIWACGAVDCKWSLVGLIRMSGRLWLLQMVLNFCLSLSMVPLCCSCGHDEYHVQCAHSYQTSMVALAWILMTRLSGYCMAFVFAANLNFSVNGPAIVSPFLFSFFFFFFYLLFLLNWNFKLTIFRL